MFRHLILSNKANIKIRNNNLIISQDKDYSINLEDISTIVLESREVTLSTYVLSKINEYDILLLTCDDKHLINGKMHSIHSNFKSSSVLKSQINLSKPVQNNLWKNIISQKIYNQGLCLEILGINGNETLMQISKTVKSNDKTNREAYAASVYFKKIFQNKFNRRDDNLTNAALNYGYSIVRSSISRYCAAYGLNTELGIFHNNELNNFNLVDDLIEPLRPFVDLYIISSLDEYDEMNSDLKHHIVNMQNFEMILDNKSFCLDTIIDLYVRSFKSSVVNNDYEFLKIPILKPLKIHCYE